MWLGCRGFGFTFSVHSFLFFGYLFAGTMNSLERLVVTVASSAKCAIKVLLSPFSLRIEQFELVVGPILEPLRMEVSVSHNVRFSDAKERSWLKAWQRLKEFWRPRRGFATLVGSSSILARRVG